MYLVVAMCKWMGNFWSALDAVQCLGKISSAWFPKPASSNITKLTHPSHFIVIWYFSRHVCWIWSTGVARAKLSLLAHLLLSGGITEDIFMVRKNLWCSPLPYHASDLWVWSSPHGHVLVVKVWFIYFLHSPPREWEVILMHATEWSASHCLGRYLNSCCSLGLLVF